VDRDHPFGQGRDRARQQHGLSRLQLPAAVLSMSRVVPALTDSCLLFVGTRRGVEMFMETATTGGHAGSAATTELVTALPASLSSSFRGRASR
jgi:hypothetical protein